MTSLHLTTLYLRVPRSRRASRPGMPAGISRNAQEFQFHYGNSTLHERIPRRVHARQSGDVGALALTLLVDLRSQIVIPPTRLLRLGVGRSAISSSFPVLSSSIPLSGCPLQCHSAHAFTVSDMKISWARLPNPGCEPKQLLNNSWVGENQPSLASPRPQKPAPIRPLVVRHRC